MPSYARKEIVCESEVQVFRAYTRCVRRAFLCGDDLLTGKNFDHRKEWVEERLQDLSSIMALDICGFAVMGNHLHVVVRTRPDLVAAPGGTGSQFFGAGGWIGRGGYREAGGQSGARRAGGSDERDWDGGSGGRPWSGLRRQKNLVLAQQACASVR